MLHGASKLPEQRYPPPTNRWVFCACNFAGATDAMLCVGRAANTTPVRGIRPPAVRGFEPPDFPSVALRRAG
ncbi:hypothetical protein EIQ01_00525 [Xanthomonas campestris pv. raphani]